MAREGTEFNGSEVAYPPVLDGAPSRALAPASVAYPLAPAYGGAASRGPEVLHGGFDQTWLFHCLRRRWLMAGLMGLLVGAATAALLLWLFPSVSQVTAYLKVKATTGDLFEGQTQRLMPQDVERQAMNHLALLKSPLVLMAATENPDINELDAIRNQDGEELLWLMDELKVTFPGDGEILEVRYEGEEDADQMVKVVNAVVNAYQQKVLTQDKMLAAATREDLGFVLQETKTRIEEQLQKLKARLEDLGIGQEEVEIPQLVNDVRTLEGLIVTAKRELVDIEVIKEIAMQAARSPGALEAAITAELDKDPTLANYKQTIFDLSQALQQRQSLGRNPNSAEVRRLQAQIDQAKAEESRYRTAAKREIQQRLQNMPNEALRATMAEYTIRKETATANLKEYESQRDAARAKLMAMGVSDPESEMLQQNIESETEIAKSLEQKVLGWQMLHEAQQRQAQSGQESDLEKVSVMQKATPVYAVNTVERWSIAGVGGVAAFCLTCYGIALLEFRHRRLNTPADVDEGLGVRVLGVLPPATMKSLAGNSLVATQVAESIDNVRATLMHDSTATPRQVVIVTSSASQEGTSIVASSLALSLSRAGRRTLLVDGDLRAPSLHKLFGMAVEDGLSEVLRTEIDLADAIRPTNNEGLYLLTAGVCSAEAVHALATDLPQAIFEKLRDQFDFVVIDTPPVLGISDTLSMGQYVDGAILTVLRDESKLAQVNKAVDALRSMGIRLVGAVVNGVPLKADRRVVRLHQTAAQRTPKLPAMAEG